jgi:hypothetical protein
MADPTRFTAPIANPEQDTLTAPVSQAVEDPDALAKDKAKALDEDEVSDDI